MYRFLLLAFLFLSGCSTFSLNDLTAEGSQASAFCTLGGPGGLIGVGPGGIVTGAKANAGFEGTVAVDKDCAVSIKAR